MSPLVPVGRRGRLPQPSPPAKANLTLKQKFLHVANQKISGAPEKIKEKFLIVVYYNN
jgi:hypothetical protein